MTVRLFKNAYLERMTYMPIYLFLPVWLAAIVVVFVYSLPQSFFHGLFLYVSGYLTWTLTEYLGHRFFFHFNFTSESGRKLIYVIHGNHHELPKDKLRNMMPLSITIPLAILIWAVAYALSGRAGTAFFGGFLIGYFLYDLIHYGCHQWSLNWRLFKRLKRHHLAHHHAAPDRNYAVSTTFWDAIFRTKMNRSR